MTTEPPPELRACMGGAVYGIEALEGIDPATGADIVGRFAVCRACIAAVNRTLTGRDGVLPAFRFYVACGHWTDASGRPPETPAPAAKSRH